MIFSLAEKQERVIAKSSEIETLSQKLQELQNKKSHHKEELSTLRSVLGKKQEIYSKEKKELHSKEMTLVEKKTSLKASLLSIQEYKASLTEFSSKKSSLTGSLETLNANILKKSDTYQTHKEQKASLEQESLSLEKEYEQDMQVLKEVREEKNRLDNKGRDLEMQKERLLHQMRSFESLINEIWLAPHKYISNKGSSQNYLVSNRC